MRNSGTSTWPTDSGQDGRVIVQRDTLAPVSHFGEGGRLPGRFYAVGSVAVDSKGNVYTGEDSDGKRVQKWINKGMGPAAMELRGDV